MITDSAQLLKCESWLWQKSGAEAVIAAALLLVRYCTLQLLLLLLLLPRSTLPPARPTTAPNLKPHQLHRAKASIN